MQAKILKALHLDTIVDDIPQRVDLTHTAQRLLGNLYSSNNAEAKP
jgi:hypothetical protein